MNFPRSASPLQSPNDQWDWSILYYCSGGRLSDFIQQSLDLLQVIAAAVEVQLASCYLTNAPTLLLFLRRPFSCVEPRSYDPPTMSAIH